MNGGSLAISYVIIFGFTWINSSSGTYSENQPEKHRMKRSFFFRNGTLITLRSQLEVPISMARGFSSVSGLFRLTFPIMRLILNNQFVIGKRSVAPEDQVLLYRHIEELLAHFGFPGLECAERMVCEIAENPMHGEGLIGDLLDMSLKLFPENYEMLSNYWEAEMHGTHNKCFKKYNSICPYSIFSIK